jgi:hypothetical protein
MLESSEILTRIGQAQSRNALLGGAELVSAASALADLAARLRARLVAADGTGDRIIGAAGALRPEDVRPADVSARLDGQTVLLVSGAVAGSVGLMQDARRLRNLGAVTVHAAVLDGWADPIEGCDDIHALSPTSRVARARPRSTNAA